MKKIILLVALSGLLACTACTAPRLNIFDTTPGPLQEYTLEGKGKDKILVIPVSGMISDAPQQDFFGAKPSLVEQVVVQLNKAKTDSQIKAVLLKVNSSGGTVTASDLLYNEISAYKAKTGNKVTVAMMDVAASGAYYLSLPADLILAHPTTLTARSASSSCAPRLTDFWRKSVWASKSTNTAKTRTWARRFANPTMRKKR
jgi:protease-4